MGQSLVPALLAQGHEVVCAVRPQSVHILERMVQDRRDRKRLTLFQVSGLGPDTAWRPGLDGVDTVIHLAGLAHVRTRRPMDRFSDFLWGNYGATLSLGLQASEAGVRRFIFISTIGVNGQVTEKGRPFTEEQAPEPENAYSVTKLKAEHGLMALAAHRRMSVIILRPPLVYGPFAKANFLSLMNLVATGMPLPFLHVENRKSFIGLGNLVDVILTCLAYRGAGGRLFLVSDGQDVSTKEFILRLARAMGKPPRLFPMPKTPARFLLGAAGKQKIYDQLWEDLTIDNSRLCRELGWSPKFSMDQELARSAQWYKDTQRRETRI